MSFLLWIQTADMVFGKTKTMCMSDFATTKFPLETIILKYFHLLFLGQQQNSVSLVWASGLSG